MGPDSGSESDDAGDLPADAAGAYPACEAYPGEDAYPFAAAHGYPGSWAYPREGEHAYPHRHAYPGAEVCGGPATRQAAPAQPLRAIHVGPALLRGGAEQWLIELTRFLDPRRVQLLRTVVVRPELVDPAFVADVRIPVEVGARDAVRRAAQECDVLLGWGLSLNDWLGDGRPPLCVYLAHGEGQWTRTFLHGSDRAVDHVVAVSQAVKERACAGFPTTVIFNGVDSARLGRTRSRQAVREALGFGPGDFVLGFVGRFAGEKRAAAVLDAVAGLPPAYKALLVGWGAERGPLLERANDAIPGRYAFVTAWNYLGDYYQAMDAVCLVSAEEGFSLVLLEAMMCGRPLIVTAVGCVPEVVHDRVNGVVVSGTPDSIAAAAELLRRHPEWARGVAAEGRAFAEQHGHAMRMARDYENLLHRLWAEKHGNGA
jgi:glycosyltransferase involved in cell wall biosynthesis